MTVTRPECKSDVCVCQKERERERKREREKEKERERERRGGRGGEKEISSFLNKESLVKRFFSFFIPFFSFFYTLHGFYSREIVT